MSLATAPPPVQSTYGQTRLRSPPPHAAGAAEEDEEGMYASEEPSNEIEQVRVGNHAPIVPAKGHAEHEVGHKGQREDAVTGASGDI
jgi:hypothetical protein